MNWKFETQPQPQLNNRQLYLPRGKTLGGSSSINGMVYIRGNHGDYDEWRQRGWAKAGTGILCCRSSAEAENQSRGEDEFHGVGGPLHVSDQPSGPRTVRGGADGLRTGRYCAQSRLQWREAGRMRLLSNGQQIAGGGGVRRKRIWNRRVVGRIFVVRTGAHATKVLIENDRATGVEYHTDQGRVVAKAQREVVVSGGAYGSPQLLQLSGIGPADHLQELGVPVVKDMPSVGSNLHDHFNTNLSWRCAKAITLNDLENSWPKKISAAVRYALFRSGPMASNGIHAGLFTRSDPRLERPDLQINIFEWSTLERNGTRVKPHPFPGFTLMPVHLRPDGRGTVRLKSSDPLAPPAVLFDYLRTDYDIQALLAGIRLCRSIAAQPALRPYTLDEILPGTAVQSDDDMVAYVRESGVSNQHPTSSCAMGHGPNTVVDPRLRVHGIDGLRVADASIMPVVVGGNTNAPTIMIGEKCAAMMLEDAA